MTFRLLTLCALCALLTNGFAFAGQSNGKPSNAMTAQKTHGANKMAAVNKAAFDKAAQSVAFRKAVLGGDAVTAKQMLVRFGANPKLTVLVRNPKWNSSSGGVVEDQNYSICIHWILGVAYDSNNMAYTTYTCDQWQVVSGPVMWWTWHDLPM